MRATSNSADRISAEMLTLKFPRLTGSAAERRTAAGRQLLRARRGEGGHLALPSRSTDGDRDSCNLSPIAQIKLMAKTKLLGR